MTYYDDDREYILPRFMGYKCPYHQCDVIKLDHDFCQVLRARLEAVAEKKMPDDGWEKMFEWNYNQWLIKNGYASFDSVPS